jgi:hypothetical protein
MTDATLAWLLDGGGRLAELGGLGHQIGLPVVV